MAFLRETKGLQNTFLLFQISINTKNVVFKLEETILEYKANTYLCVAMKQVLEDVIYQDQFEPNKWNSI